MIICCDMDNVLNDLTSKTIALYNKRYGGNITLESLSTYDFSGCLDPKTADKIVALFEEKELWDSLEPLPDSQKRLKALFDVGHTIYIATATAPNNFAWKCEFLKKYFPFVPIDNVIRIKRKELLNADIIIDDCMEQLVTSAADRICLTYPWNIDPNKDFAYDIFRCKNWNDILNAVKNIERKNKEFFQLPTTHKA